MRVETAAVVGDGQQQLGSGVQKVEVGLGSRCMPPDVGERLLGRTEQGNLLVGGQGR